MLRSKTHLTLNFMAQEASQIVEDLHKETALDFTSTATAQNMNQHTALTSHLWGDAQASHAKLDEQELSPVTFFMMHSETCTQAKQQELRATGALLGQFAQMPMDLLLLLKSQVLSN